MSILQIYAFNIYSQCWIGSFLVADWLLGSGGLVSSLRTCYRPIVSRGGVSQVLYNVTWGRGVENWYFFIYD